MLVHDGHFCASLKTFSSSLQTDQIFFKFHFYKFLNFWSQSTSYNFVNSLFMSIFWTVNHWDFYLCLFSLIIYLYLIMVCPAWLTQLMIVSSYYLWADSPLLHCVLVYVPMWLCVCALSCIVFAICVWPGVGGGGGGSEVRQCYVFILSTYFFLFFSLKKLDVKEEINSDTYIYSCEQEWERENVIRYSY